MTGTDQAGTVAPTAKYYDTARGATDGCTHISCASWCTIAVSQASFAGRWSPVAITKRWCPCTGSTPNSPEVSSAQRATMGAVTFLSAAAWKAVMGKLKGGWAARPKTYWSKREKSARISATYWAHRLELVSSASLTSQPRHSSLNAASFRPRCA